MVDNIIHIKNNTPPKNPWGGGKTLYYNNLQLPKTFNEMFLF